MKTVYSVNHKIAPVNSLEAFTKWHKECCKKDPMKAEERYKIVKKEAEEWVKNVKRLADEKAKIDK